MAYKGFTKTEAVKLCAAFKELRTDIAKNKKKTPKKELKVLEKKLDTLGKKAQKKLETDVMGCKKNFSKHATMVDKYLELSVKSLQQAKTALKSFKGHPNMVMNKKPYETSTQTGSYIDSLLQKVQKDAKSYGIAWADYRRFDPSVPKIGLDKKLAAKFNKTLAEIENAGKAVAVKIKKIGLIKKQADMIKNGAEAVERSWGDRQAKVLEMVKKAESETRKLEKGMRDGTQNTIKQVLNDEKVIQGKLKTLSDKKYVKKNKKQLPVILKTMMSMRKVAIAKHRHLTNTWRTIEKMNKQMTKVAGNQFAKDPSISKLIKDAAKHEADASKIAKQATTLLKKIVPNVGKIEKIVKANVK